MQPANPRPELGAHRYQGPFATSHDYQEVREREGKSMCTLLTCDQSFWNPPFSCAQKLLPL